MTTASATRCHAIAVSVVDPPTSTDAINRVAAEIPFFTFDSDATQSNRIAYVGSSNTELGTASGELMKKAMEGKQGKCIGFVGLPGADNAKERIKGYNEAVKGTGLELIDVRSNSTRGGVTLPFGGLALQDIAGRSLKKA